MVIEWAEGGGRFRISYLLSFKVNGPKPNHFPVRKRFVVGSCLILGFGISVISTQELVSASYFLMLRKSPRHNSLSVAYFTAFEVLEMNV